MLHLILEVGISDSNSLGSGTIVVCSLSPVTAGTSIIPSPSISSASCRASKTNFPPVSIPTLAPKEIFALDCICNLLSFALESAELHALALDVDMSANSTVADEPFPFR